MAVDLRSYVFLDSLQPQHAAFLGTVARGFLPLPGDASLWVEISPGIEINRITDVALKATPGAPRDADRRAPLRPARSPLGEPGRDAAPQAPPSSLRSACARRSAASRASSRARSSGSVDAHQVQLINRMRHGHMLLAGQTLYVLEVEPAGYAALAANEAEKAAEINILEVIAFGSFGRVLPGRRGAGHHGRVRRCRRCNRGRERAVRGTGKRE